MEPLWLTELNILTFLLPRTLSNGVPVYSEQEYSQMLASKSIDTLPALHYIQLAYYPKRQCPVEGCPATKLFKTEASFQEHWNIFHEPNVRFCHKYRFTHI